MMLVVVMMMVVELALQIIVMGPSFPTLKTPFSANTRPAGIILCEMLSGEPKHFLIAGVFYSTELFSVAALRKA